MKNKTGKKLSRRLLSCLLAVVMLLSLAIPAGAAFSDVSNNSWYADEVEYCRENGLMSGTSATEFSPNTPMTRDMLITVLYRLSGSPTVSGVSKFEDAVSGRYYYNAVLWAEQNGIAAGLSETRFGVDVPVNREQMAVFFWRYAGEQASETSAAFADQNRVSSWAVDAVNWAKENRVLNGKGGNRFDPQGTALRCEVATVLKNYAENVAENGPDNEQESSPSPDTGTTPTPAPAPDPDPKPEPEPAPSQKKVLVTYFSCTNTTKGVAHKIKTALGADAALYEITPQVPYTNADLNYSDPDCRANREQNDSKARPQISGSVSNMSDYDIVFLGYPIWWGQAPKIINTFLESYDFSGKTIVPFCTSGGSSFSNSTITSSASGATWINGRRFNGSDSQSTVANWVNGLNLDLTASAN